MIRIMTWLRVCSARRSLFFSSPSVGGGVDVFSPALAARHSFGRGGAHWRGALKFATVAAAAASVSTTSATVLKARTLAPTIPCVPNTVTFKHTDTHTLDNVAHDRRDLVLFMCLVIFIFFFYSSFLIIFCATVRRYDERPNTRFLGVMPVTAIILCWRIRSV